MYKQYESFHTVVFFYFCCSQILCKCTSYEFHLILHVLSNEHSVDNIPIFKIRSVLEYESPNIQIDLASNPKFLEQIEGALQSLPASFRLSYLLAMSLLTALTYNLDTHRYLCKPHVIQSIIRTWKNADPTPENNATRGESIYLK